MESPPKRMTRARAAAKASESASKPTKIVTAAAKARTTGTATASTKSTAAKRKTRADENEHDDDVQDTGARRAPRGRPRKVVEPEEAAAPAPAPAPAKPTRGRPAKKPAVESPNEEEPAAPAKPRGRPRKVAAPEAQETAPEPAKKTTRSRATTVTKPSTAATKPAVKKTVKFQEPDKENIQPQPKAKEPAATGLRGRPARRGGAAAARTTKTAAKSSDDGQKKPLSPKKVTQMPVSRDDDSSEDELAMETVKTPVKHMMKSPIKPPANVIASTKKPEFANNEAESITVNTAAFGASSLGSPPRRPPASPLKDSLKSPAKRMGAVPLPGSTTKPSAYNAEHLGQTPSFKTSLLQSAAKRPQSPVKGLSFPPASASKLYQTQSAMRKTMLQSPAKRAMPGFKPLTDAWPRDASSLEDSPKMQPLVMATPTPAHAGRPSQTLMAEEQIHEDSDEDELFSDPTEKPQFCGRLSAVLPRHADPILNEDMTVVDEEDEGLQLVEEALEAAEATEPAEQAEEELLPAREQAVLEAVCPMEETDDPMALDEVAAEMEESGELPAREPEALPEQVTEPENPMYQLRQKDMDPFHDLKSESDSENEAPSPVKYMPHTPSRSSKAPRASRRSTIGLASLAEQFGSWSAASPVKADTGLGAATESDDAIPEAVNEQQEPAEAIEAQESPMKSTFFEDEMSVHVDPVSEEKEPIPETSAEPELDEPSLDDIMVIDEDVALAQEANDMSAMETEEVDEVVHGRSFDDGLSEASQEYGDENQIPVDPAMMSQPTVPVTPVRPMQQKSFFTTTKVPLKPADDSTPSPLKKRSFSASRIGSKRPDTLPRSATVISYSPIKEKGKSSGAPVTPSKTDMWSTMGTPARTPRRDLDPALLRGAVVFVDVHTTEGADASGIFVELLNQMGARCVKTWHWNPSSPVTSDMSSNKVGITHVVYKDGGKRTLEKVREANGVVHCVGVSWVLDCERENEWLDEAPYYIDTTHVPRGGARRRKSMEPKALANLNGTIVSSPVKGSRTPTTPMNRRDSTMWMPTPSDQDEGEGDEELEWSCVLLTPVPKTPAPDAVARYAAELPETPSGACYDDMDSSPTKQALVTRTCPPKANPYRDMGAGVLSREKDEQVLQRLMAARRKSLQFAPRIGSPLSRTWK
ncbi:Uncharacterized protein TPAR_04014 [Tolypocladium paradoxum]|uniref:BRCT domain-containing protein n=1 Tax=Tolypocladium paradoxum TaxID=94208 RepID=A0A2S4L011_9HYPO|nr:Uncharacterized protein TPAR_04014 [Tolypocladium paradoxum]